MDLLVRVPPLFLGIETDIAARNGRSSARSCAFDMSVFCFSSRRHRVPSTRCHSVSASRRPTLAPSTTEDGPKGRPRELDEASGVEDRRHAVGSRMDRDPLAQGEQAGDQHQAQHQQQMPWPGVQAGAAARVLRGQLQFRCNRKGDVFRPPPCPRTLVLKQRQREIAGSRRLVLSFPHSPLISTALLCH